MRIYCGRSFSPDDIQGIRNLIEQTPTLKREVPVAQAV